MNNAELKNRIKELELELSNLKSLEIAEISKDENQYRFLFETSLDGYALCQVVFENNIPTDWIYLEVNPAFEKLTGLQNVIGKKVTEIIPDTKEKNPEIFEIYGTVALTGEAKQFEIFFQPLNKWFAISVMCPKQGYFIAIFDDISASKQSEKTLKESNDKFLNLANSIIAYVAYVNADTLRYEFVNDLYEKSFGIPREKIIGKHIKDVIGEKNYKFALKYIDKVKTGKSVSYENTFDIATGKRWLQVIYTPVFDDKSKVVGIALVSTDITKHKQAEETHRESEERFALVIDASEQGIWDWNVETNEIFYSEQWKKQIGYKDHELKNDFNTWVEHLHPDEIEYCQNTVYSYLNQPVEHFLLEFRFRHKDGTYRWIHNKASSLKNNEGKVIRLFGTHTDITERKQAEQKHDESKKMLKLVMDSIPQFIFWKDRNSVYLGCNENFAHVAGLKSEDEIAGKTDNDLSWKKEEADFFVECDKRVMDSGTGEFHIIEPQLQADGKRAWLDTNKVPIVDATGLVIGILGTYEDITERKRI